MFESIIQYFIEKGELHERAALDARSFAAYLENQTEYTKERLRDVIRRLNYDTVQPDANKCFPHLEFWRGVDGFGSSVALSYDGGVDILQDEELIVKKYLIFQTVSYV